MKNFYHWISLAAKVPYYGPTEGAVTFENGERIVVDFKSPNARQVLGEISTKGKPTASFLKAQKSNEWIGTMGRNMKDALDREVTLCGAGLTLEEAIADLNNEVASFTATKEALLANPEALLREHLRCHDWYACMSDSYAVARAGDAHMDRIKLLMAKMDKSVARSIYREYAPPGMDMDTYFSLPEFQNHPEAVSYRKQLGEGSPPVKGEIREGMLVFNEETACCWGGPYPCNTAQFRLIDCREWSDKWCGRTLAAAQKDALELLNGWLARIARRDERNGWLAMRAEVEKGNAAVIHQLEERGTVEYPIRIWVLGNDDTSYSKWFATVEEAEELLTLMENMGPLDFEEDFLPLTWTFTN